MVVLLVLAQDEYVCKESRTPTFKLCPLRLDIIALPVRLHLESRVSTNSIQQACVAHQVTRKEDECMKHFFFHAHI